jgi:hypothetical protein
MNLHEKIDFLKLSDDELMKINSKLPKPNQEIVGHVSVLPVTVAMGCQITVLPENDLRFWLQKETCFLLDGKKISYPCFTNDTGDATWDFLEMGGDHYCVGTGSLEGRYKNHLDSLYAPQFFRFTEKNLLKVDLESRESWCCTMSKQRDSRDLIVDHLESKYMNKFTGKQWFCYDGIDLNRRKLIKKMYRPPGAIKIPSIEYCDGIDYKKSRLWTDVEFTGTIFYRRKNSQGAMNNAGGHLGSLLGPWHKRNLIELVSEATHNYFECTEKIVKPMRAGMPFVVIGCEKFLYRLKKMGFRTFDPFIDESYDREKNWQKRTRMAVDSMFEFLKSPTNLQEIGEICKHNQDIIKKISRHDPIRRTAKKLSKLISFSNSNETA